MNQSSTLLAGHTGTVHGQGAAVKFPESLPGLDGAYVWELVEHEDARPFLWLRSVDRPGLSLLVIDPRLIAPGYKPAIGASDLSRVELGPQQKAILLSVVSIEDDGAFANLVAPVIINPDKLIGAQVILDKADWPLRHPIMPDPIPVGGTGRSPRCSYSAENQDNPSSSGRRSG